MTSALPAATELARMLSVATARWGREVALDPAQVLDRSDGIALMPAGIVSPNGSCRLIACRDGWIAANLPRESDRDLVPAWLGRIITGDSWQAVIDTAATCPAGPFAAAGAALGLAVARVGETQPGSLMPPDFPLGKAGAIADRTLDIVDLSSLWAGPLCSSVFAAMGHDVTRIESIHRPDPTRDAAPALNRRLNGGKTLQVMDFSNSVQLAQLQERIVASDILITGARPRGLAGLGLEPSALFSANPALIWVAITGHGWFGAEGRRIGFGDDAAAAGGLLDWQDGEPRFAGDALADPLTGMAAAIAALDALAAGGGVMIDAALARVAAGATQWIGENTAC